MATKIESFTNLKEKSDKERADFLMEKGVKLNGDETPEVLLQKCASWFLNKEECKIPPTEVEPKKDSEKIMEAVDMAGQIGANKTKTEKAAVKKQDHDRCSICEVAITSGGGKDLTSGKPLCKECLTKVNIAKERGMKTNAKKSTKAAAKKSIGTKTQKKRTGNPDALKKAREAKVKKHGGETIGSFIVKRIKEAKTKTNAELAEEAKTKFGSNTTPASVAWYRNKLKHGEIK